MNLQPGMRIRITEAEGDCQYCTDRTVYAVFDDGWYDTHGTFWPLDNDQYRYTLLTGPRP